LAASIAWTRRTFPMSLARPCPLHRLHADLQSLGLGQEQSSRDEVIQGKSLCLLPSARIGHSLLPDLSLPHQKGQMIFQVGPQDALTIHTSHGTPPRPCPTRPQPSPEDPDGYDENSGRPPPKTRARGASRSPDSIPFCPSLACLHLPHPLSSEGN
jgi:hypothetical protein